MINPYSAEHPVPPSKFAGRKSQIREFTRFLDETFYGNSKNLALLGEWGIGKTSLLRKFREIAEEKGFVAAIIELGTSVDSLVTLFEVITKSLAEESQKLSKVSLKVKELLENLAISATYGSIGVSVQKKGVSPNIVKFKKDLKDIRGQLKKPFIIMLDNAERLLEIQGSLMELRNVFQSLQSMEDINCMVILAGREKLFSDIRSIYEPAVRFFWGIGVDSFTTEETKEAILKPLINSDIKFSQELIVKLHKLAEGHPYFIQLFAYSLFNLRRKKTISLVDLNKHYDEMFDFIGKRLFESILSLLSGKQRSIILRLAKKVKKNEFTNAEAYSILGVKDINQYLKRISEMETPTLEKVSRGRYKFYHPLFKEYICKRKSEQGIYSALQN